MIILCDVRRRISLEGRVNVRIPGADDPRETTFAIAADDAVAAMGAAGQLLEQAIDVEWYEEHGSDVDRAAVVLCRLRRAFAGQRGGPQHGDEAVRVLLERASPEAIVWIASRAISYMDEYGFPEAVEDSFPEEREAAETGAEAD
jgi:hypothetical protein